MQIEKHAFLVAGGGSGLGAATAQRLVSEGANVVIADVNDAGGWVARQFGDQGRFIHCDVPVWVPVFCIIALLIWISSPGAPVMFSQLRTGKGGRRIYMYKFRTMVSNAEELKSKYAHLNELKWPDFKITNDPRITFIGRILRKTSLDELPQLINVLRREMSLVGPRHTSFGAETYKLWHTERLDVIPGITGLWQIEGRGRLEFDLNACVSILPTLNGLVYGWISS